eukprot:5834565-Amphidinium_carterae.1
MIRTNELFGPELLALQLIPTEGPINPVKGYSSNGPLHILRSRPPLGCLHRLLWHSAPARRQCLRQANFRDSSPTAVLVHASDFHVGRAR